VAAGLAAVGAAIVVVRLGLVRADLAAALGPDWADRIPSQRRARMVGRWWRGRLPTTPEPRLRQDVAFATVPGTGRKLRCDLWQPPAGVPASGLAVVYLHGSAWYILDKDVGTRPLFRHLAAQGHAIVDVAYRLFPETDLPGMVADTKRALAWVTRHAAELEVRPDRVVLAGGSAGGHLALLAAYAPDDPTLTRPSWPGPTRASVGSCRCTGRPTWPPTTTTPASRRAAGPTTRDLTGTLRRHRGCCGYSARRSAA
jgi:acetyl esterase/lipase